MSRRLSLRAVAVSSAQLSVIILLGVGIGAVYWIPAFASVPASMRPSGVGIENASAESYPPTHLITLVMPNFYGTVLNQNYWGYFLGHISQVESSVYIGILPLVFIIVALREYHNIQVIALALVGMAALLFAMGHYTPLYQILYNTIPGLSTFRVPSRFVIFLCFSLSALAALGFSIIERKLQGAQQLRKMSFVLISVGIAISLVWVLSTLLRAQLIAVGTRLAQLLYERASWNHIRPLEYTLNLVPMIAATLPNQFTLPVLILVVSGILMLMLKHQPRLLRLALLIIALMDLWWFGLAYLPVRHATDMLTASQSSLLTQIRFSPQEGRVFAEANLLPLDLGQSYGFADVQGDFPTTSKRYWEVINFFDREQALNPAAERALFKQFNARALQLLNVKTAITLHLLDEATWRLRSKMAVQVTISDPAISESPIAREAFAYTYENRDPLPRIFMAYHSRVIPDDNTALAALYDSDFDPAREVILDVATESIGAASSMPATIFPSDYSNDDVVLKVTTGTSGILVLNDVYAPGWTVTVDGNTSPLLRADYTLRAVYVPAGTHRIEFQYWPPGLSLGIIITVLSLGTVGVGMALEMILKRSCKEREHVN